MARSDSPEFRFRGLRCDAVEELPGFHLPAPQVLTQDRWLQIVRNLLDPNRLAVTPEADSPPRAARRFRTHSVSPRGATRYRFPPISNGFTGVVRICPDFRPRTTRMRDPRTLTPRFVNNETSELNTCLVSQSGFSYRAITSSSRFVQP